ncbi:MAG: hypothetical protein DWQ49_12565 [Bacteroidetes bacterium]|nr:MAG: hypothetical protein DWQ49_12565 [Bacteroidota bacterium]
MKLVQTSILEWNSKKTFELADEEIVLTYNSFKGSSKLKIPYSDLSSDMPDYKISYAPYSNFAWITFMFAVLAGLLDLHIAFALVCFAFTLLFLLLYVGFKREYKACMNKNHKTQSLFFIEMDDKEETKQFIEALKVKLS